MLETNRDVSRCITELHNALQRFHWLAHGVVSLVECKQSVAGGLTARKTKSEHFAS